MSKILEDAQRLLETHIQNPSVPQAAAATLGDWHVPDDLILPVLLLPVLQLKLKSPNPSRIASHFGKHAVDMARQLDQLLNYTDDTAINAADKLRRLFRTAYVHTNLALVYAAYRSAQAQHALNPALAESILRVDVPFWLFMGLRHDVQLIGNLCLERLHPAQYEAYKQTIHQNTGQQEAVLNEIITALPALQVRASVISPLTLYRPDPHLAPDSLHVDILLDDEVDCYRTLGMAHRLWRPLNRVQDYIAQPQRNGYRCLTTAVTCQRTPVTFHIRTQEMETVNSYGVVAALFAPYTVSTAWWHDEQSRQVIQADAHKQTPYVFTPTGDVVYPIRQPSTVLDFAFRVHSALGPHARRFYVNGVDVPPQHILQRGDLVEIDYDMKQVYIEPEWLACAESATTRKRIDRLLKQQERIPQKGRQLIDEVLEREMQICEVRFPLDQIDKKLRQMMHDHGCASLQDLYDEVAAGRLSPDEIVAEMIESELVHHIVYADTNERPSEVIRLARSWMQAPEPQKWHKSQRVLPGVPIVGRRARSRLTVHRADSPHAPIGDDAVALAWRSTKDLNEAAEIHVYAPPRANAIKMVLNEILNASTPEGSEEPLVTIHHFQAQMQQSGIVIKTTLDAPSIDVIARIEETLLADRRMGYITDYKLWQLFPGQRQMLAQRQDRQRLQPYSLKQITNDDMFFGRADEIQQITDAINEGQTFIVLYGQKRIGKTSLLYQLAEYRLREACDVVPVQFDVHSLAQVDSISFLHGLAEATYERLGRGDLLRRTEERNRLRLRERDLKQAPYISFARWVRRVEQRLSGRKLMFIVDEFTTTEEEYVKGHLNENFFDGIQWLVGSQNIGFLLCVHDHIFNGNSRSWGLLQRGQPIRLDALDRRSARQLIEQPVEQVYRFAPGIVDQILDLTNCHPFYIQALCYELTQYMAHSDDTMVSQQALGEAMQPLLRSGLHYFSHYQQRLSDDDWDILKIIAMIEEKTHDWISREMLQEEMVHYGLNLESWRIRQGIGTLYKSGILTTYSENNQAYYRIQVGLFRKWLSLVLTDRSVRMDLQRED